MCAKVGFQLPFFFVSLRFPTVSSSLCVPVISDSRDDGVSMATGVPALLLRMIGLCSNVRDLLGPGTVYVHVQ